MNTDPSNPHEPHPLDWVLTDQAQRAIEEFQLTTSVSGLTNLRKQFSAEQVQIISGFAKSRHKAQFKLDPSFAKRVYSDTHGMEMASSALASLHKAKRFKDTLKPNAIIADLCSGIGADSWAFDQLKLDPFGIDIDPDRCWMYTHNLHRAAHCMDALSDQVPSADTFHLDPARRTNQGQRFVQPKDFSPGPHAWDTLINTYQSGAIKLNPGIDPYQLPEGEIEIISESGHLTQAVLWVGSLANPSIHSATRIETDGSSITISGQPERPEDANRIEENLGTLDPSLERADLVGTLLDELKIKLVHPGTGMVTTSSPIEHPMVRWHKVVDIIPWNRKKVKAILRAHGSGIVQVRTRDGLINTDIEQRELRGKGSNNSLTVFVYRIDQKRVTIIAQQI